MSRRVVRLSAVDVAQMVSPCGSCAFWQLPASARRDEPTVDPAQVADWVRETTEEWGTCGFLLRIDDVPVGHILYAPPVLLPGAAALPSAPANPESVLLAQLRVRPDLRGRGLAKVLFQAMLKDLIKREATRMVEAFGSAETGRECVLPKGLLTSLGFREHHRHPCVSRFRRDLKSTLTWRAELEAAADRLLKPVLAPTPQVRQEAPWIASRSADNCSTPVFGSTSGVR